MTHSLFGAPQVGGSFSDNVQRALDFANANIRRAVPAQPEVVASPAAEVATELAAPVAALDDGTDVAAAIRAAAADAQPAAATLGDEALHEVGRAQSWRQWDIGDIAARLNPGAQVVEEGLDHAAPSLLDRLRAAVPDSAVLRGSAEAGSAVTHAAIDGAAQATRSLQDELLQGLMNIGKNAAKVR